LSETIDYYPYGAPRFDEKAGNFNEGRKYIGEFCFSLSPRYTVFTYENPCSPDSNFYTYFSGDNCPGCLVFRTFSAGEKKLTVAFLNVGQACPA